MKKKIFVIIPLVAFLLCGCWDKKELEDYGYVAVIGLDKEKEEQKKITFQLINPQVGTSTKINVDEPAHETVTISAPDILIARDLANTSVTRRLTFTHAKAFIIGEELAKEERFYQSLEAVLRDRDVRNEISIIVSRENAADFIRGNKSLLETRPNKFYSFMAERWKETGLVPLSTLHSFVQRTQDDTGLFLATYATAKKIAPKEEVEVDGDYLAGQIKKEGGNPTQMIGSAVFKEGRMIGTMTGEETRLALVMRPTFEIKRISISVPDPMDKAYRISARLELKRNKKIKINTKGNLPTIEVYIPAALETVAIPSFINYATDLSKQKLLKEEVEKYLEDQAKKLIKRTQQEFGGEPFQWGLIARKEFHTIDEFIKYDWMKTYPTAKVNIHFDVDIENFGKQFKPPNLDRIRD